MLQAKYTELELVSVCQYNSSFKTFSDSLDHFIQEEMYKLNAKKLSILIAYIYLLIIANTPYPLAKEKIKLLKEKELNKKIIGYTMRVAFIAIEDDEQYGIGTVTYIRLIIKILNQDLHKANDLIDSPTDSNYGSEEANRLSIVEKINFCYMLHFCPKDNQISYLIMQASSTIQIDDLIDDLMLNGSDVAKLYIVLYRLGCQDKLIQLMNNLGKCRPSLQLEFTVALPKLFDNTFECNNHLKPIIINQANIILTGMCDVSLYINLKIITEYYTTLFKLNFHTECAQIIKKIRCYASLIINTDLVKMKFTQYLLRNCQDEPELVFYFNKTACEIVKSITVNERTADCIRESVLLFWHKRVDTSKISPFSSSPCKLKPEF